MHINRIRDCSRESIVLIYIQQQKWWDEIRLVQLIMYIGVGKCDGDTARKKTTLLDVGGLFCSVPTCGRPVDPPVRLMLFWVDRWKSIRPWTGRITLNVFSGRSSKIGRSALSIVMVRCRGIDRSRLVESCNAASYTSSGHRSSSWEVGESTRHGSLSVVPYTNSAGTCSTLTVLRSASSTKGISAAWLTTSAIRARWAQTCAACCESVLPSRWSDSDTLRVRWSKVVWKDPIRTVGLGRWLLRQARRTMLSSS